MTDLADRTPTPTMSRTDFGITGASPPPLRARRRRKGLVNVLLAAVLAALVFVGYNSIGRPTTAKATPRTTAVVQGVVQSTVTATGNVAVVGDLAVNFTTAGKLVEVDVAGGDKVTRAWLASTVAWAAACWLVRSTTEL